ncbi:MAG: sodium:proton antiporter [Planctomycetes bacterium]|nr:sodium:proton antiporter [Planctomycetota bacterium]
MMPLASAAELAPPIWSVLPFVALLLSIAIFPLVKPHFWEKRKNQALVAAVCSIPAAVFLLVFYDIDLVQLTDGEHLGGQVERDGDEYVVQKDDGKEERIAADRVKGVEHSVGLHKLLESIKEYTAFIVLLATLFTISGGIYLRGSLAGTPLVNTIFMGVGAVIASFIGTTGAATLLIRPLLRANEKRRDRAHIVVFFIFIVCNGGGMLTPLGDPPLFLGFLRGVPFLWTFRLFWPWLVVNAALLVIFNVLDQVKLNKEERERPGAQLEEVQQVKEPLRIEGLHNFALLLGVIAVIYCVGTYADRLTHDEDLHKAMQVAGMLAMMGISWFTTKKEIRVSNRFTWAPISEVAVLFAGIFVTMVPALQLLEMRGGELGVTKTWQFFWATGMLSSFLDNAPTYLVFVKLGQGAGVIPMSLAGIGDNAFLAAISCAAVFMGANTYIGNGPNFMIKAIAEENQVKMPSFFGYMLWSIVFLIPLFVAVTFLFFI